MLINKLKNVKNRSNERKIQCHQRYNNLIVAVAIAVGFLLLNKLCDEKNNN